MFLQTDCHTEKVAEFQVGIPVLDTYTILRETLKDDTVLDRLFNCVSIIRFSHLYKKPPSDLLFHSWAPVQILMVSEPAPYLIKKGNLSDQL